MARRDDIRMTRPARAGGARFTPRLVLVADHVERPGRDAVERAPADQRLLAAMGHPDLARARAR